MKKISDYRKLLGVSKTTELKELKTIYRNFMKDCHPDKFQDEEGRAEAELRSKDIIEAYHFLVSIAPETLEQTSEVYNKITTTSSIIDYEYKAQTLIINFSCGNGFEFFDVPKNVYIKLVNSDSPGRFARRHVYQAYSYRSLNKLAAV